jgi:arginyl-tRNA synthetase
MGNVEFLQEKLAEALKKLGVDFSSNEIEIQQSKEKSHGDFASNIALKLSSKLKKNPRDIANLIISNLNQEKLEKIEIAGPGFINFFLKNESLSSVLDEVLTKGEHYGDLPSNGVTINLEYVSANPTGDLHLGHARGAAIGDSLARIFKKGGYNIIREYYVNDAGAQMLNLAKSLKARYFALYKKEYPIPEDGYHGKDVIDIAKSLKKEFKDQYLQDDDANLEFFKQYGKVKELDKIKDDLREFRVEFDVFTNETDVRANDSVEKLIKSLDKYVYTLDGAKYLRTTDFLDDKDRVIVKSNGDYTYFVPDIVYHLDKLSRKADRLIDVLGADHHGYINRMKSALMMNGYKEDALEVELIQMVRIMKDGEEVKMSKRTGNAIKMRDLVSLVGVDACRYFFVEHAASSHLDFNLDIALAQSNQNPVYYAQYAHARIMNVLSLANIELNNKYYLLSNDSEFSLMKCLGEYGNIIQGAVNERAPYKICNYVQKLASLVHEFYAKYRIIDNDNMDLTGARLSLMKACAIVLKNSLELVGVDAPNKM